ncbi:hypothetical protein VCRA2110O2_30211 [Vibrio crassostreae]|nr:hypothetical protein VCHA44O286_50163 [Vibrio chagasii]CAK2861416.1 hypothetical protein VCRA2110O2_30211 [Vibrio crassostreae]
MERGGSILLLGTVLLSGAMFFGGINSVDPVEEQEVGQVQTALEKVGSFFLDAYPELKEESDRYSTELINRYVEAELYKCNGKTCQETLDKLSEFTQALKDECQLTEVSKCQYLPHLKMLERGLTLKIIVNQESNED